MSIYLDDGDVRLYHGDALETLREMPAGSVDMVATSPPFYGLRDYGTEGQIGLEETPDQWVERLVQVFREVRRVLRDDGTLWVEIGDSYMANQGSLRQTVDTKGGVPGHVPNSWGGGQHTPMPNPNKPKDLLGQPWLLAFALRADGWYLRSEIIWARPNPMPESVTDRPTKSHSTVFLFAKGQWKSRVIALPDLHGEVVHVGNHVGPQNPSLWANEFGIRFAAAILDSPEVKEKFALASLDTKEWEKFAGSSYGETVGDLPVEHRAAMYAAGVLASHIPAKEFLRQLDRLGVTLTDGEKFRVGGGLTEFALPPGVNRYGETAVAIHDSGEIGEVDWVAHTVKCSRPSGCSYFYDADAIREPASPNTHARYAVARETPKGRVGHGGWDESTNGYVSHANARSVWTIPTEPTPFAHFATWPQKLVGRMIQAGTSEHGCCPECGKPWVRQTETSLRQLRPPQISTAETGYNQAANRIRDGHIPGVKESVTLGWSPSCHHTTPPMPCTVLDPFAGSGTTLLVARNHGRHSIGIELNADYCAIAAKRLQQLSLLTGSA